MRENKLTRFRNVELESGEMQIILWVLRAPDIGGMAFEYVACAVVARVLRIWGGKCWKVLGISLFDAFCC